MNSKHPISQDRKVVWVVSNRSSLLQLKGSLRNHDGDAEDDVDLKISLFYVPISPYPKVIYFLYLSQSYYETESRTHR